MTQTDRISADDHGELEAIVGGMAAAWNRGDGEAFAAPFAEDADFVNIRGEYVKGRRAIAAGHSAIFATIYAGSSNEYTVKAIRLLRADIALIHVQADLKAPHVPLEGKHSSLFSMVLRRAPGSWEIVAFHNTLME